MIKGDEVRCDWCGNEMKKESLMILDLSMPFYNGPYIHIINDLCPACQSKTLAALGDIELEIKTGLGA